jgi:hypothetical protein
MQSSGYILTSIRRPTSGYSSGTLRVVGHDGSTWRGILGENFTECSVPEGPTPSLQTDAIDGGSLLNLYRDAEVRLENLWGLWKVKLCGTIVSRVNTRSILD